MESFHNVKNFKSPEKVMEPFFGIKNFKIRKTVVEFSLSFKNFKSRQRVTVGVLFRWSRFIKLSYDDQISWSNISYVSSHWISLIIITF